MSNITPFKFEDHDITVLTDESGEPWFVAGEIADVLGYSEASAMTRGLDEDEKGLQVVQTPGGRQKVIVISESGLYSAILKSEREEAGPFQKWVRAEVLPSIRKTGSYTMPQPEQLKPADTSGLPEFRRARALDLAVKSAERILNHLPSLGEHARQVVLAKIINPVAGTEVLALPHVAEKHHQAGEVGEMLGITGAMVGRIANQHNLKTAEFGEYRLDKSQHSAKQVEAFVYNKAGIEAIKQHLDADRARQAEGKPSKARRAAAPAPEPQGALL